MKYLGGNFSVVLGSDLYRQNFDRIFRRKTDEVSDVMTCPKCNGVVPQHTEGCENSVSKKAEVYSSDQNS